MSKIKTVHWIGGVRHPRGVCLPGWPCCCSGDRATKLRDDPGACTAIVADVTCAKCRKLMAKDARLAPQMAGGAA